MIDIQKYVGIPFKDHGRTKDGADCLGLIIMIYKELGINLPDVADGYDEAVAKAQVNQCIVDYENFDVIEEVTDGSRQYLDVMAFKLGGLECHVALWLNECEMLHLFRGQNSVIVRHDVAQWQKRLGRVYRYVRN